MGGSRLTVGGLSCSAAVLRPDCTAIDASSKHAAGGWMCFDIYVQPSYFTSPSVGANSRRAGREEFWERADCWAVGHRHHLQYKRWFGLVPHRVEVCHLGLRLLAVQATF